MSKLNRWYTSLYDILPKENTSCSLILKANGKNTNIFIGMTEQIKEQYHDYMVLDLKTKRRHGISDNGNKYSWIDLVITICEVEA